MEGFFKKKIAVLLVYVVNLHAKIILVHLNVIWGKRSYDKVFPVSSLSIYTHTQTHTYIYIKVYVSCLFTWHLRRYLRSTISTIHRKISKSYLNATLQKAPKSNWWLCCSRSYEWLLFFFFFNNEWLRLCHVDTSLDVNWEDTLGKLFTYISFRISSTISIIHHKP